MFWLKLILILLFLCGGLWVMATGGRRDHPKWAVFRRFRYAHRGLHDREAGAPENSLPAFRRRWSVAMGWSWTSISPGTGGWR